MGTRCGCVSKDCTCAVATGHGVSLSGVGSQGNPYLLTAVSTAYISTASSSSTDAVLTGDGSELTPYALSLDFIGAGATSKPLDIATHSTQVDRTPWVRPPGCTIVWVVCIGGGAGGQAGASDRQTGFSVSRGGSGGGGGAFSGWALLLTTETHGWITVGGGGYPGLSAYGSVTGQYGYNGGASGFVTFNAGDDLTPIQQVWAGGGRARTDDGSHVAVGTSNGYDPNTSIYGRNVRTSAGGGGGHGYDGGAGVPPFTNGDSHAYLPGLAAGMHLGNDGGSGGGSGISGPAYVGQQGYSPGGGGGGGGGGVGSGVGVSPVPLGGRGGAGGSGLVVVIAY